MDTPLRLFSHMILLVALNLTYIYIGCSHIFFVGRLLVTDCRLMYACAYVLDVWMSVVTVWVNVGYFADFYYDCPEPPQLNTTRFAAAGYRLIYRMISVVKSYICICLLCCSLIVYLFCYRDVLFNLVLNVIPAATCN